MNNKPDNNHYMTTVKIGPKGQIVIPKEIREMFALKSGDSLIIMADKQRGIALHRQEVLQAFADAVFEGKATDYPTDNPQALASAVNRTKEKGEVCE